MEKGVGDHSPMPFCLSKTPGFKRRFAKDPLAFVGAQSREVLHGKLQRVSISLARAHRWIVTAPHHALWTKGLDGHFHERRDLCKGEGQGAELAESR